MMRVFFLYFSEEVGELFCNFCGREEREKSKRMPLIKEQKCRAQKRRIGEIGERQWKAKFLRETLRARVFKKHIFTVRKLTLCVVLAFSLSRARFDVWFCVSNKNFVRVRDYYSLSLSLSLVCVCVRACGCGQTYSAIVYALRAMRVCIRFLSLSLSL